MDDLANRMRAAADSPPPTRIDLDALISSELTRRRNLRWAGGAAAVAAVVTLAIAGPTLYLPGAGPGGSAPGPGAALAPNSSTAGASQIALCAPLSPSPTGPQPPLQSYGTVRALPTEPVGQAIPRLTEAARLALRGVLPSGMTVESLQQGCAEPQFQYHPSYRTYDLAVRVKDQKGFGYLSIELRPTGTDAAGQEGCLFSNDPRDCTRIEEPDGTIVIAGSHPVGKASQHQVFVFRPDGVTVSVASNNYSFPRDAREPTVTRPEPPLTIEHLIQIGRTPGLTLYP